MKAERLQQIDGIFHDRNGSAARAAREFLDKACANDSDLRSEVEIADFRP